jgi:dTDP-4-amino-4,6-dideoxygalactose transaminase
MNAAYLWAQLELADEINGKRLARWEQYNTLLQPLREKGIIELPAIPEGCVHNAHMYYIKTKDIEERTRFINFMKSNGILTVFHYIPLHTAPAGRKFGYFHGEDVYTTKESERLVRLPMYYSLKESEVDYIVDKVKEFYQV